MANKEQYTARQFIKAIPGTGGIISTIAARVGCDWDTAKKYITTKPSVARAYRSECESITDTAVSVVSTNIQLAKTQQEETRKPVDTSDAKWWLARKRKDEFSDRHEVSGPDGQTLRIEVEYVNDPYKAPDVSSGADED